MLALRRVSSSWRSLWRSVLACRPLYVRSARLLCTEAPSEKDFRHEFENGVRPRHQVEKFRIGSVSNSGQLIQLIDQLKERGTGIV